MADYRSKSYSYSSNRNMQMGPYYGPNSSTRPNNPRSYSFSYASYSEDHAAVPAPPHQAAAQPQKLKKGKSSGGSNSKSWNINDPEFQRKRRVASYKVYSAEGKVKASFRKSFRWFKDKYSQVVYGWW